MNRTAALIAVIAIPVLGYGIMHMLAYTIPMSETSTLNNFIFTIVLIILGLGIPYWFFKTGAHAAHMRDMREKEVELKDIPKDKDQLSKTP